MKNYKRLKKESIINLSALGFDFCSDDEITDYYGQKMSEIKDKERWINENREKLSQNRAKILKAVEDGLIPDDRQETIWQFQHDKVKEEREKVLLIKREFESKVEDIKKLVTEKLSGFLPDWILDKATIPFTMNNGADFCVNKDVITVDLGRLTFEKDFFEKAVQGIAHEVFHVWMSEKSDWSDAEQDKASDDELRKRVLFKTIDEELAVLVGGQSLRNHHEKQDRKYDEFIQESFVAFNKFASTKSGEKLKKIKDEEFQNMGHFYVVGNEIAQTFLANEGIEKFRKFIEDIRENPTKVIELYKSIHIDKHEFPKLNRK